MINTNFALNIGLSPATDALILELANQTNPYANIIAVLEKNLTDKRVIALVEVLKSLEIQSWIENHFDGNVVPDIRLMEYNLYGVCLLSKSSWYIKVGH